MNRIVLVFAVLIALGIPAQIVHQSAFTATVEAQQQDPSTLTVYLTRTGERYHRDGCRFLRQSRIATTLKEAVSRGFGPCGVCRPPTLPR